MIYIPLCVCVCVCVCDLEHVWQSIMIVRRYSIPDWFHTELKVYKSVCAYNKHITLYRLGGVQAHYSYQINPTNSRGHRICKCGPAVLLLHRNKSAEYRILVLHINPYTGVPSALKLFNVAAIVWFDVNENQEPKSEALLATPQKCFQHVHKYIP